MYKRHLSVLIFCLGMGLGAATPISTITVDSQKVGVGSTGHSASVPSQAGMHYFWTITNGAITSATCQANSIAYKVGQSADPVQLTCIVTDPASLATAMGTSVVNVVMPPDATVSVPRYVTSNKAGYIASAPSQPGATFAWSISGGGVITGGQGTNSIIFTAPAAYSASLVCTVINALGVYAQSYTNVLVVPAPESSSISPNTSYPGNFSGAYVLINSSVLSNTYHWEVLDPSLALLSKGNDMRQVWFDTYNYPGVNTPIHFQCTVTNAAGDSASVQATSLLVGGNSVNMTADPATPGDQRVRVTLSQEAGFQATTTNPPPSPQWSVNPPFSLEPETTPDQCFVDVPESVVGALYGTTVHPALDLMIHVCDMSGVNCSPWNTTWPVNMTVYSPPNATITAAGSALVGNAAFTARIPDQPGNFHWSIDNGFIVSNQGEINPSFGFNTPGIATITCDVINVAGRHATSTYQVHVYPKPIAPITVSSNVVSRLAVGCVASVPTQDGATYGWSITGGTITSGQGSPSIVYSVTGAAGTLVQLSCTVAQPNVSGSPSVIGSQSISIGGELVINEIGSSSNDSDSRWIEVHNLSTAPVNLSSYQLRTPSITKPDATTITKKASLTFSLPSLVIPGGGYAVIRGLAYSYLNFNGPALVCVDDSTHTQMPYWLADGFVELTSGGRTVDFVRFGSDTTAPGEAAAWPVATAAPALPVGYGQSIDRDLLSTDSNLAADWKIHTFATFGGPNDVDPANEIASDGDGIPDVCKVAGATFAGLPLYTWGARKGQTDVFIHLEYMNAAQNADGDLGYTPQKTALDNLVAVFKAHKTPAGRPIVLHIDAGSCFPSQAGDLANYNMDGQSHMVDWKPNTYTATLGHPAPAGAAITQQIKAQHMPLAEKAIFHYLLLADEVAPTGDLPPLSTGQAECPGNDALVTLGHEGLDVNDLLLINIQAGTIMHELGHNFGLRHGGNDEITYKPNYLSVMNYLYQWWGLPVLTSAAGDRYYFWRTNWPTLPDKLPNTLQSIFKTNYSEYIQPSSSPNWHTFIPLVNPPNSSTWVMDYSEGSQNVINEQVLNEPSTLLGPGSTLIDFNGDLVYSSETNFDVNGDGGFSSSLPSYNDWANLQFFFDATVNADTNIVQSPRMLDDQSVVMQSNSSSKKKSVSRHDVTGDAPRTVINEESLLPPSLIQLKSGH